MAVDKDGVKTSYVVGARVAKATNPVGDNPVANAARGFAMYYDDDVAAVRRVVIDKDKAAFKRYLLKQ